MENETDSKANMQNENGKDLSWTQVQGKNFLYELNAFIWIRN